MPWRPEIVEGTSRPLWLPVAYNSGQTIYDAQIVTMSKSLGGVVNCGAATGTPTTTLPLGIVLGNTNVNPVFDSTYLNEKVTAVQSQAAQLARDWRMQEGMFVKNDPQALVQVALLYPDSVVRLPIYGSATAYTAPGVGTVTTGAATGTGFTCASAGFDFTAVAGNATYFCRTGLNRGLYRIGSDTNAGTGAKTFTTYWPYSVATGDTFVGVNLALGDNFLQLQTLGFGVDNTATVSTAYYAVRVIDLDLTVPGQEYALVRFIGV
jgi:hypothetical protein